MKKIELNPTNEYHLLRHFSNVSGDYIQGLIGQKYYYRDYQTCTYKQDQLNSKAIKEALATKGSKFFKNIKGIENPKQLLQLIQFHFDLIQKEEITWRKEHEEQSFCFIINYPIAVGYKNLISISDLTPTEQKEIKTVARSMNDGENNVMIKTVTGIKVAPIHTITVAVIDISELSFYLVTAYPGDGSPSPDFPNSKQSATDYQQSFEFWSNHVFVE
jgi:hypothetical protein